MHVSRGRRLIEAVEHELELHKQLLCRLRLSTFDPEYGRSPRPRPSSGRFWMWVLPENTFDLYEQIKVASRVRREMVSAIAGTDQGWSLPRTLISLGDDDAARLSGLRDEFGVIVAAISRELRQREIESGRHAARAA